MRQRTTLFSVVVFYLVISYTVGLNYVDKASNLKCNATKVNESLFYYKYFSIASTSTLLTELAEAEENIYALLKTHLLDFGERGSYTEQCFLRMINRYLTHFEETTGRIRHSNSSPGDTLPSRPRNVAWNPIATFQMLRRFRMMLMPIYAILGPTSGQERILKNQVMRMLENTGWPSNDDVIASMRYIIRIQDFYDLSVTNVTAGVLMGEKTGVTLSASDCVDLGLHLLNLEYYALSVEWLEESLLKDSAGGELESVTPINKDMVKTLLLKTNAEHDMRFDQESEENLRFFSRKIQDKPFKKIKRRSVALEQWKFLTRLEFDSLGYARMCSGANFQPEWKKAKLFCYYETKSNPAWLINPLKVELLGVQPLIIVQYYDVIGDSTIRRLKENEAANLEKKEDLRISDMEFAIGIKERKALGNWAAFRYSDNFGRLIELITGLNVQKDTSSEPILVSSYPPGGHYTAHTDSFGSETIMEKQMKRPNGDRIASFLFYLSDVVKGGKTVFPQSGLAITPVRGSAVTWFNLKRSTEFYDYTWHGACPLVLGEKWIANKWICTHDQMFLSKFTCAPDKEALIDFEVNGKSLKYFM